MMNLARLAVVACGVATALLALPARADEPPGKEADNRFEHGVELMKADDCAEAIPEFLKSQALESSAATLLNLGTCYARLGRKATAWKAYQRASIAAQSEQDAALRERALQAMAILGPTLTKVQIVTPRGSQPLSLRLNGEELVNYDGLPIPLDPGESVIEAAAPGREPWRHSVKADDLGATLVVQVPELAATRPSALPPPSPVFRERREEHSDLRIPAAIVGGVGLASVLVGSIFGLSAAQSYDDSQPYCAGNRCTQSGIDLRDRASTKAAISTWTVSLGLVATATGVVMWLVSPTHSSPQRATAWAPVMPVDGGFMMLVNEHR